jgi:hypothetical protein
MGAPRGTRVQHFDASIKQAEASGKALELMHKAQGKAYTSGRLSTLLGQEAVARVEEGVGLLGQYLKDRNLATQNQLPLDASYAREVTDIGTKYAGKAGSIFGGM